MREQPLSCITALLRPRSKLEASAKRATKRSPPTRDVAIAVPLATQYPSSGQQNHASEKRHSSPPSCLQI
eukprot:5775785-Pyramimonas_sp.AAC.2